MGAPKSVDVGDDLLEKGGADLDLAPDGCQPERPHAPTLRRVRPPCRRDAVEVDNRLAPGPTSSFLALRGRPVGVQAPGQADELTLVRRGGLELGGSRARARPRSPAPRRRARGAPPPGSAH